MFILCPNGCGEFEIACGRIDDNKRDIYFKVNITYCPICKYINAIEANL
jgi:hypothetical protein